MRFSSPRATTAQGSERDRTATLRLWLVLWVKMALVIGVPFPFLATLALLGGTYLNGLALLLTVKQLALPDLAALLRVRLEERAVLGNGGDRKRRVLVPAAHHGLSWLRVGNRVLQFWREVELFGGVARHAEVENRSGVIQDDLPLFQEFPRVLRQRDLRDPELPKAARAGLQVPSPGGMLEHVAGLLYHVGEVAIIALQGTVPREEVLDGIGQQRVPLLGQVMDGEDGERLLDGDAVWPEKR